MIMSCLVEFSGGNHFLRNIQKVSASQPDTGNPAMSWPMKVTGKNCV